MVAQNLKEHGSSRLTRADRIARRAFVMSAGLWVTCLSMVAFVAIIH